MTTHQSIETSDRSLTRDWLYVARYYLSGRRSILILVAIAIVAGIAFNWSWLVATGIAPILLTALPCLVMCGFGLCANRLFGRSCESQPSQSQEAARSTADISRSADLVLSSRPPSVEAMTCCHGQLGDDAPADPENPRALDERRSSDA